MSNNFRSLDIDVELQRFRTSRRREFRTSRQRTSADGDPAWKPAIQNMASFCVELENVWTGKNVDLKKRGMENSTDSKKAWTLILFVKDSELLGRLNVG